MHYSHLQGLEYIGFQCRSRTDKTLSGRSPTQNKNKIYGFSSRAAGCLPHSLLPRPLNRKTKNHSSFCQIHLFSCDFVWILLVTISFASKIMINSHKGSKSLANRSIIMPIYQPAKFSWGVLGCRLICWGRMSLIITFYLRSKKSQNAGTGKLMRIPSLHARSIIQLFL